MGFLDSSLSMPSAVGLTRESCGLSLCTYQIISGMLYYLLLLESVLVVNGGMTCFNETWSLQAVYAMKSDNFEYS